MRADRAQTCARLFAETTRDGVYTHGINRFPRFVGTIRNGCVDPAAEARRVGAPRNIASREAAKQSPIRDKEIASSQNPLLAMTREQEA